MLQYITDVMQKISNMGDSSFHQTTFIYALYISYVLVAIAITGVVQLNSAYLETIQTFIKYYVSIFLMARFNPLVKTNFTQFDVKIAWSAGVFLFITTSIFQIIQSVISKHISANTSISKKNIQSAIHILI